MPALGETQGPGATAEFARPDFDAPAPRREDPQNTGGFGRQPQDPFGQDQYGAGAPHGDRFARPEPTPPQHNGGFVRSDVFGGQPGQAGPHAGQAGPNDPAATGGFPGVQGYDDDGGTGQHRLPERQSPASTGQFEPPQVNGANGFAAPQPPVPQQRPAAQEPQIGTAAQRPNDGWRFLRPPVRATAAHRCTTRWRPTGSTATVRRGPSRTPPPRPRSPRPPSPRPRRRPSGPPPPPGAARPTTTSSDRPSASGSPRQAGSPPPACRAGSPGPTSSRARLSSSPTRTVRRSRVRPTTCAAG